MTEAEVPIKHEVIYQFVDPIRGEYKCRVCGKADGCDHLVWKTDENGIDKLVGTILNPDWLVNLRVKQD